MISGFTYLEFIAAEGDFIRERRPVLAVDTYKVSFELYCPVSGKVVYLNQELDGEGVEALMKTPINTSSLPWRRKRISTRGENSWMPGPT